MKKIIGWFSCGITSAVACKLALEEYGKENVELYYIVIDSAHWDNERFIRDCEKWYGKKINRVQSDKYTDQFDVIKRRRYINGVAGAQCTKLLKKDVRKSVEDSVDFSNQIFGFEFEKKEINRAIRFSQQHSYTNPLYPLIDNKLNKNQCADIILKNGIKLPKMYELGFLNNNCIMCVKGGMSYANKIRKHFPDYFERMSDLEQEVGATCIKGKSLKDLKPEDGRDQPPILPDCGTFCEIEFAHIIDAGVESVLSGLKSIKQLKLF